MNPILEFLSFFRYAFRHPGLKRLTWVFIALVVIDLVLATAYGLPLLLESNHLQKVIDDHKQAVLQGEQAGALSDRLKEFSNRAQQLGSKLESSMTQSDLIRSLDQAASREGLHILSQDFSRASASASDKGLRQDLTVTGNYASVRRFLNDLENLPVLTVVENLRLERLGQTSMVRANLELVSYGRSLSGGL